MAEIKPSKNYVLGEYLGKYEAEPLEEENPVQETNSPHDVMAGKMAAETSLVKLEDGTLVLLPCYFSSYVTPIPGKILIAKDAIIAEVSGVEDVETPEEEADVDEEIDLETDEDLMNV